MKDSRFFIVDDKSRWSQEQEINRNCFGYTLTCCFGIQLLQKWYVRFRFLTLTKLNVGPVFFYMGVCQLNWMGWTLEQSCVETNIIWIFQRVDFNHQKCFSEFSEMLAFQGMHECLLPLCLFLLSGTHFNKQRI